MKVNINNKEIELKNKLRSILIYEQIAGKTFNPVTLTDMMLYMYCVILANDSTIELTFMDFMDMLDENPNLFSEFNEWLVKVNKVNSQFTGNTDELKKNLSK